MRDMNSSPLVTVPAIINWSEGEPVEKGPVRGCMSEVRACKGLEPPEAPLSCSVVGDAPPHRCGSVVELVLNHGGGVMMPDVDVARRRGGSERAGRSLSVQDLEARRGRACDARNVAALSGDAGVLPGL